jgi:hypothetical protein
MVKDLFDNGTASPVLAKLLLSQLLRMTRRLM